ncbi:MAG: OmpH family outer membrane protein [Pyrinomonadaceae bacterium]
MISRKSFLLAVAFIAFAAGSHVFAQTGPAAGGVPVGKIAVIFSEAFQDPKIGIAKFNVLQNQLVAEFKKSQDDLTAAAQRVQTLQDEITKLQSSTAPVDPKTVQAKVDQLDQLRKESQRKLEDTQASYQKRRGDLLTPLQEEVGKALDAFAKTHGITLIIDGSQVPGVLFAADSMDVTKAFITDYNAKNPVTASTATPR